MNTSKFLIELRKIVREEISLAIDEIKKDNKRAIKEALLSEAKSLKATKNTTKPKKSPKSGKSSDRELVESVKKSMAKGSGGRNQLTESISQPQQKRESLVKSKMKNLPSGVMSALAETENDLASGRSAPIGGDQQGESIVMQEHAMFMDRAEIAEDGYESPLELGDIRRTSDDVPVDYGDEGVKVDKSWKAILDKSMELSKAKAGG